MNTQDMERECCVKAGIERYTMSFYEHSNDGRVVQVYAVLYENESVRPNVKQPVVYDEPTGTALVKKLKAELADKDVAWDASRYYWKEKWGFRVQLWDVEHCVRLGIGVAATEDKAFVEAYYSAYCEKKQKGE